MTKATATNGTFSTTIEYASRNLNALEKVALKDTRDAVRLDKATADGSIVITPAMYAVINVYNEKSDDKEYKNYVIIDADGTKYVTGSVSFFNAFVDIWNELDELTKSGEVWQIKVYQMPSNNYKDRNFLTCSVAL